MARGVVVTASATLAAAVALLLGIPSAASAANPSILNTGTGCNSGGIAQTAWLVSCATGGQDDNSANQLRITTWLSHDADVSIASLITDDDWDGTVDPSNIRSVSGQRPSIAGGYPRSRVNLTYQLPTGNTGMSCSFGFGTRRTDDRNARFQARDNNSPTAQTSSTSSSRIKFVGNGGCLGPEDYAYLYSWGANNFGNSITPGQNVTFTYNGDDPDTTGSADFNGVNWRRRNLRTGTVSGTTLDCDNNGDNATKSTTVTFPDRGSYVVEAQLMDGGSCSDNQNSNYWFPIGTADVNSSAAPSLNLDSATTTQSGVVRPQWQQDWTVRAQGLADPDSGDGGGAQILEWDLNNTTGDGVNGYETNNFAGFGSTLTPGGTGTTRNVDSSPQSPGLYSVRARVTDNGAGDAADSIRRRSGDVTLQYRVDAAPTADSQTVTTTSDAASVPITLTGSDPDGDPLTYAILDAPDHGQLCTTASGNCTAGTGPGRFYRPDHDFAGTDTFTFRTDDGFGRQSSTATVTINVRPDTVITSRPDDPSGQSTASFEFNSPATMTNPGNSITFECRIDSSLESDFSACTSPKAYTGLSDGQHTFEVRARSDGSAGSFVDPTPASYTWTVDSSNPETFIDTGPPNPTSMTTASFTFHSDDPLATFQCRLDNDPAGFTSCNSPQLYTDLDEGQHTFQVRATDQFNRTDPVPASYTWSIDLTAPTATIDSAPADPSNQTSATFEFSSTDPSASFQCRLDSNLEAAFVPCSSPQSYGTITPLGEGQHTFDLRATDPAGNVGEIVSYVWTIDTTVPETSLDSGPPPQTTSSVASFEFSSGDPTAGFQCRLDSTDPDAWEECSSPQLYADLADGTHNFEVRAVDDAGNIDGTPESQTWEVDGTAPQTTIDSAPSSPTTDSDAEFRFSSDDAGASFECKLDTGTWDGCIDPQPYSGLSDGTHVFRVRASDPLGNTDPTPASRTWTVDTDAPAATIEGGPANPSGSTEARFEFSSDEPGSTFQCRLDSTQESAFAACSSPAAYLTLSEGSHTFDVRATDAAGNTGQVASRTWIVDTTAPDAQITAGPPATSSDTAASFQFASTDGSAGLQCRLDGGPWQACISPRSYNGLNDGQHSFDVRATDPAGNTGTPAHAEWTVVDSGAPNTWITSAPSNSTFANDANFAFAASEPSTFACSLDGGAFAPCGSVSPATAGTKSYTGLAAGAHTFQVRATDDDAPPKTDATPAVYEWHIEVAPPSGSGGGSGGGGSAGAGGVAGVSASSATIKPGRSPLKRARGVAATVDCPAGPCAISGKGKLKVAGRSFAVRIKTSTPLAGGQSAQVTVVLPKAARAALARAGKGTLKLELTATSAGAPASQKIKLKVTK